MNESKKDYMWNETYELLSKQDIKVVRLFNSLTDIIRNLKKEKDTLEQENKYLKEQCYERSDYNEQV